MNNERFLISGGVSGNADYNSTVKPSEEQTEDDIILEVAQEEGLTYEEVKAVWDTFKNEAELFKTSKKTKVSDENKKKSKRKAVKQSRKRNR